MAMMLGFQSKSKYFAAEPHIFRSLNLIFAAANHKITHFTV